MSNVNIQRAVENIRVGSGVNVYTPVVEIIVNAIQSIDYAQTNKGLVEIVVDRAKQIDLDGSVPDICGFTVIDNGVGFTEENRRSFDELYSDHKIKEGGKGFGRFTCLKYFEHFTVKSVFSDSGEYFSRSFDMGKKNDIIINEQLESTDTTNTGSTVKISTLRNSRFPDKQLSTIARVLVERLLPYFFNDSHKTPKIILRESDESEVISLNDYLKNHGETLIKEVTTAGGQFTLKDVGGEQSFIAKVFKLYSPREKTSKVSLVAHRREVTSTSLHNFIPEFMDEFYEKVSSRKSSAEKNFIIKVYVSGEYLDKNVSLERGGFEFQKNADLNFGIAQSDIETAASTFAKNAVNDDVEARREKKTKRVFEYVRDKAPWHSNMLAKVDLADMPYNASDEQIESKLQRQKYQQEVRVQGEVKTLLEKGKSSDLREKAQGIVQMISDTSKNDLAHYVAMRRSVIDIFEKSLQLDDDGSYSSEGVVHDIIFPRKGDTAKTPFDEHNLWLIDERLNFTEYVASDIALKGKADRPDLLAYDKRVVFRGENEPSNPVSVFEFKRPQRDDFTNPSSNEDPVQQVVRYVRRIRKGDFKTPQGRELLITDNTPFYGYVVCDLTRKVKTWLEEEKDFKQMPDRQGYFKWHDNLNLYIEVVGWDKVLKDATMRNRIFFHKLNI